MGVRAGFDAVAREYDAQRRRLVPGFDEFYTLPFLLTECKKPDPKVLDIGAGTGLFSYYMGLRYPKAQVTLVDLSGQMLEVAQKRFAGRGYRYIEADYAGYRFEEKYDMVISALSIHHLNAEKKKALYHTCYDILEDGGILINADQVLSPSPKMEQLYRKAWRDFVRQGGFSEQELEQAFERTKYDDPSTLEEQLGWLSGAGFPSVDCIYKYMHFCTMVALK